MPQQDFEMKSRNCDVRIPPRDEIRSVVPGSAETPVYCFPTEANRQQRQKKTVLKPSTPSDVVFTNGYMCLLIHEEEVDEISNGDDLGDSADDMVDSAACD